MRKHTEHARDVTPGLRHGYQGNFQTYCLDCHALCEDFTKCRTSEGLHIVIAGMTQQAFPLVLTINKSCHCTFPAVLPEPQPLHAIH